MNYIESSHRHRWVFTAAQLVSVKQPPDKNVWERDNCNFTVVQSDIRKGLRAKSIATISKVPRCMQMFGVRGMTLCYPVHSHCDLLIGQRGGSLKESARAG